MNKKLIDKGLMMLLKVILTQLLKVFH